MSEVSPYRRRAAAGGAAAVGAAAPPFYQSAYVRTKVQALHFVDDQQRAYYRITEKDFPDEYNRYGNQPDFFIVVVPRGSEAKMSTRGLPNFVDFPHPNEALEGNLMETVTARAAPASVAEALTALRQHASVVALPKATRDVLVHLLKSASVRGEPPSFNPTDRTRRRLLRAIKKLLRVCVVARDAASVYLLRGAALRVQNVYLIPNAKRADFMRKVIRPLKPSDVEWLRRAQEGSDALTPVISHKSHVGARARAQCKDVLRVPDNLVGIVRLEFFA